MGPLINRLHQSKVLCPIIHTLSYCLQRELRDCKTVLDLGCGISSPLQFCKNIQYSVGVEIFVPYLEASKNKKIHTKYINKKIEDVDFQENSFDAVIIIEVLEHLLKDEGLKVLQKADRWARKKVIVSTPNGFFLMGTLDGNSHQQHLSGWDVNTLSKSGYKCYGMSGAKFFYLKKNTVNAWFGCDVLYSNIRFKPKKLFYLINGLAQMFVYYAPKFAFGLLAVKENKS